MADARYTPTATSIRELIREAGGQGLTLLKNKGSLLPINAKTTKLAVVGPFNANRAIAGGGGSASLNPYYNTIPLDSIREASHQEVLHRAATSTSGYRWPPHTARQGEGAPGVAIAWFAGDQFEGAPVVHQVRTNTDLFLRDSAPREQVGPKGSAVATTSTA